MRGYQEMLLEFISDENIKMEDIMEILHTGMYQIDRIGPMMPMSWMGMFQHRMGKREEGSGR